MITKINKPQYVELLAVKLGITTSEAEKFLEGHHQLIYELVAKGVILNFSGFGQFLKFETQPTIRKHPHNGEMLTIPAHFRPKFKVGEQFKQAVK